jgi:hypothetical protein
MWVMVFDKCFQIGIEGSLKLQITADRHIKMVYYNHLRLPSTRDLTASLVVKEFSLTDKLISLNYVN